VITRAAVLRGLNQEWDVVDIEVDPPKTGEIIVEWKAAGLCHSDEHMVTGDLVPSEDLWPLMGITDFWPMIGGHEGAGIVVETGPNVSTVAIGDHVAASFVPSCGRCRFCSTGRQYLCDSTMGTFLAGMITDGTSRHRMADDTKADLNMLAKLGTFAQFTCVAESQVIKVEPDLPLEAVALVSCGVATGFGSATSRADVKAGDTVVVVGAGGIGMNAIQGAAIAGASRVIAVDPVEFKREKAMEFGATHTYASMEEAFPHVQEMTWGYMAEKVIMTPSVLEGEMMQMGMSLAGKGGTIVVTAIAPMTQTESSVNLFELAMWNKEIKGTIFGSLNPRADIPRLLGMYREGQLKLDELITKTYTLDEINEGYRAMRDGENIRGVIIHA
jgi:NDMA-dependent alcohol dehydrogenase